MTPVQRPAATAIQSVLVLANFEKPAARALAAELEPWLRERVARVALQTDVRRFSLERERAAAEGGALERPDLLVVLGGDGAILGTVRAFARDPVPALGINLGRIGFLASTPAESWREALSACLAGEAVLEPRLRIGAQWRSGSEVHASTALNEVTIQRGSHQGMLQVALWAKPAESTGPPDWVTTWRADGIIVATPSGSTAYALSAGGPILEPSTEALVVTPICPQGLVNRPIVLPPTLELVLSLVASSGIATLALDGHLHHALAQGENVHLARHPVPYPLYRLRGMDPYRRLRERLGWRGSPDPREWTRPAPPRELA